MNGENLIFSYHIIKFKCHVQPKTITRHTNKHEIMAHSREKKIKQQTLSRKRHDVVYTRQRLFKKLP